MSRRFSAKPVMNKKNGQINFSLPKRKLPKEIQDIMRGKNIPKRFRFKLEGFDNGSK